MDRKKKHVLLFGGVGIGFLNGLFGSGGGMILVPLLYMSGIGEKEAHASSIAVLCTLSMLSAGLYLWRGSVTISDALPYLPGALFGSLTGAWLMPRIPVKWLKRIFAVLMIYGGVRMVMERPEHSSRKRDAKAFKYSDGSVRIGHAGMRDARGTFCYMLDADQVERFEFVPPDERASRALRCLELAERSEREARGELGELVQCYERALRALEKTIGTCGELMALCSERGAFRRGEKSSYQGMLSNARRELTVLDKRAGEFHVR